MNLRANQKNSLEYKQSELFVYEDFQSYFKKNHKFVLPLTQEELKKMNINTTHGLPHNFCLAQQCPFYLKKMNKRLNHHLSIWENQLPKGFHEVVKHHRNESVVDIFNVFMNRNQDFDMVKFETNKEEIMEYIAKVKECYANK